MVKFLEQQQAFARRNFRSILGAFVLMAVSVSVGSAWAFAAPYNTGGEVFEQDYRWQVAIKITAGRGKRCGGVLIAKNFVLTAAHCVDNNSSFAANIDLTETEQVQIFHGADTFGGGRRLDISTDTGAITIHPGWKRYTSVYAFDAALIRLKDPVQGATLAPIRKTPFTTGNAIVSGWGDFDRRNIPSTFLRAVKLPVVINADCQDAIVDARVAKPGMEKWIRRWSLCTISDVDDACARDSGGGLVIGSAWSPQTIGVVSWGPATDCGPEDLPEDSPENLIGVYTRTSEIAVWVEAIIGDSSAVTSDPAGTLFDIEPRMNFQ